MRLVFLASYLNEEGFGNTTAKTEKVDCPKMEPFVIGNRICTDVSSKGQDGYSLCLEKRQPLNGDPFAMIGFSLF